MKKAIFLDRDGIINHVKLVEGKPYPPSDLSEFIIMSNIKEFLELSHKNNYLNIIITNQPDVSRGKITASAVEEINSFIKANLKIDDIYTCFHDDKDFCECRKPKPGNIIKAALNYQIDLSNSYMIGDRWRDIESGKNAGCKTIYVDYNYRETKPTAYDFKVNSVKELKGIVFQ